MNFATQCIQGLVPYEAIDDFIDQWHESNSPLPLIEFLGLTEAEYKAYVFGYKFCFINRHVQ
jgi:hypothetical protein